MAQRLGDILLARGAVNAEKLAAALSDQKAFGGKLGRTLVDLGYVNEDALVGALAEQLGLEAVNLDELEVADEALGTMSVNACERYGVFPVRLDAAQRVLWLATAEPDHATLQEVAQITQLTLEPVLAPMSQIERAMRRHYFGEKPGEIKKARKGEPLTSIPDEKPKAEPPPRARLPSSAGAMMSEAEGAPLPAARVEPQPRVGSGPADLPPVVAGQAAPQGAPSAEQSDQDGGPELEGTPVTAPVPPAAADVALSGQPEDDEEPIEGEPTSEPQIIAPVPGAARPSEAARGTDPAAPAAAAPEAGAHEGDSPFSAFDAPAGLHAIAPGAGQLDAIEELQNIVLRLEKLVSAQGRAFRALIEILQEKGIVRRGELGARTTKKP